MHFFWRNWSSNASDLILPPFEALQELDRRRQDPDLRKEIEEYLEGDIPAYLQNGPILYLARHVLTPNFETLRFIYLIKHLGMNAVVSHDSKGVFAPHNHIKKALCKLPICLGLSQKGEELSEQYQNATIVDFNSAAGKTFGEIKTRWGEDLIAFHARLYAELMEEKIESPDDATWIDRHHRDDLLEHYKHLMALFVVHGIFFENYDMYDKHEATFVKDILRPACRFVEKRFGYKPIIVEVFPTSFESNLFWISYPKKVLDIVQKSLQNVV